METAVRVLGALAAVAVFPLVAARDAEPRRVVMPGLAQAYAEKVPAAKAELLRIINEERAAVGAPPLAYDLLGAKVGDEFCEDAARNRTSGHWDLAGRPPYLRWALAGGIDHHAQNFAAESRRGFDFTEPPVDLLKKAHAAFMAEKPPDDGHRQDGPRPDLDARRHRLRDRRGRDADDRGVQPAGPRVGRAAAGPVKAGKGALVVLKLPRGWSIGAVEVAYEEFPKPMSRPEIAARGSYGLPPSWRTLRPYPPAGTRWESGESGDFRSTAGGRIELVVPLDRGPGHYYLVVFAAEGEVAGRKLFPVAAPMVTVK